MSQRSGLMQGKRGVILGVANNRSIAWGIAKACHAAGAEIALTWQGDALKKRVEPLAAELGGLLLGHCDVTDPATIDAVFDVLKQQWGKIDFVVHAIAFSDQDHADLLLFADRNRAARREASCRWRFDPDADLLRRGEMDAALQRHGRGQG